MNPKAVDSLIYSGILVQEDHRKVFHRPTYKKFTVQQFLETLQNQHLVMPLSMFKLPYTHFTCKQGYAQNPSSQVSVVHEPRTSICTSWVSKRQRSQKSNCQNSLDHGESKGIPEKTSTSPSLTVWITTNWKILKEIRVPDYLPSPEKTVCG